MERRYIDKNSLNSVFETLSQRIEEVENKMTSIENCYPIGAIYISTVNTNPGSILGFGTWTQIKDKFLLAAGYTYSGGTTGGEATHKLTVSEMPSHYHTAHGVGIATTAYEKNLALRSVELNEYHDGDTIMRTENAGGSVAHNNMPPYLTVYMWQRTV